MDLSIIIVSWNVVDKLRANLKALFSSKINFSLEVFVVDNNSQDCSVEMIKKEFPQVKLIVNQDNLGFAKANNQAIKKAQGDYILLLNPDMMLSQDTLASSLEKSRTKPEAVVSSCRLINEQGEIIRHVRNFPQLFDQLMITLKIPHVFPQVLNKYLAINFDYDKDAKVDSVRGAFFLINKKAWQNISKLELPLLDERYFIWFEEVDFCRQVYNLGGEVWYFNEASCLDYIGQSFQQVRVSNKQKYFQESMLKYFLKWHGKASYFVLKLAWKMINLLTKLIKK